MSGGSLSIRFVAVTSPFQVVGFELGAFWAYFAFVCGISILALIIVALWVHRDAYTRGMDEKAWTVVLVLATALAGFLGLVIVLAVYMGAREVRPAAARPNAASGWNPSDEALACPECLEPMSWSPAAQRWYCTKCGQYQ